VNKRVAYVPEWQAVAETSLTWNGWSFMPSYRFTGNRFTTEDERFPMPAVGLWEFSAGYSKSWRKVTATLFYRMDNAFDSDHSLIRWYPMPGRQHHLSLNLNIP
jgi:outer membrane cobalamin receptor